MCKTASAMGVPKSKCVCQKPSLCWTCCLAHQKEFSHSLGLQCCVLPIRGKPIPQLFLSAGLLFAYSPAIVEFFYSVQSPRNEVQSSVRNALKLETIQQSLCMLGLISKLVTGPWMRLVGRRGGILDLNPYFLQEQTRLQLWAQDAPPMLQQPPPQIFDDAPVKEDSVLAALHTGAVKDQAILLSRHRLCREGVCSSNVLSKPSLVSSG